MSADGCTVTWWGHATVDIRMDGTRVLTDPLLRRRVGPLHSRGHRPGRREAVDALSSVDAVLLSHLHHDHTDLPSVRRLGPRTTTVVPVGAEELLRRHARGPVIGLPVGSASTDAWGADRSDGGPSTTGPGIEATSPRQSATWSPARAPCTSPATPRSSPAWPTSPTPPRAASTSRSFRCPAGG